MNLIDDKFFFVLLQPSIGSFTINYERRIIGRLLRHRWGSCTVESSSREYGKPKERKYLGATNFASVLVLYESPQWLDMFQHHPGAPLYLYYKQSLYRTNISLMFSTTSLSI